MCIHAGRVTIQAKDIQLVQRLIDVKKNYKTDEPMTGVGGLLKRERIDRKVATGLQQRRGTHGRDGETSQSLGENDSDSDDDDDRRGGQSGNKANFRGGSSRKRRNEDNTDDEN